MIYKFKDKYTKELIGNCEKCFGLCCIALYFSALDGFPTNKDAGTPCMNLQQDFKCSVHKNLRDKGLKGCIAYDCFGAGQKIAQVTFEGRDWLKEPECANQMFESFLIMRQLHEMMWYLTEALILQTDKDMKNKISLLLDNTEQLTFLDVKSLLSLDLESHRGKVNVLLKNTSESIRVRAHSKKSTTSKKQNAKFHRLDYFGSDLRKTNLRGADLRGACLIAANLEKVDLSFADLIGADLRDANIKGANLENSIFITQAQINTTKGDSYTKLPIRIVRPSHWIR